MIKTEDTKKKNHATSKFKPETNQPEIKSYAKISKVGTIASPNRNLSVERVSKASTPNHVITLNKDPNQYNRKKRSPPTPPEHYKPRKKSIMAKSNESDEEHNVLEEVLKPGKEDGKEPELSDELKQLRKLLNEDMTNIIDPLKDQVNNLERSNKLLEEKGEIISNIKLENDCLHDDCKRVKQENKKLKDHITSIENKLLENNIVLSGILDQPWELSDNLCKKALIAILHLANGKTLQEKLLIVRKIGIKNIRHKGDYSVKRHRPISIEFLNKSSADFLFENKRKLPKGLYVDHEYNEETERERRILKSILRKAKQLDCYQSKSKLEGNQLIIKGSSYNTNMLHRLPEELSEFCSTSKTNMTSVGFFGELNVFSNFHPAEFSFNGIRFHSSEQYIQYQKAKLFGDLQASTKILESEAPLEAKKLAKDIDAFDYRQWKEHACKVCEPGILAKFLQNPKLMEKLLSTGDKELVECSYNTLWGCGKPLQDSSCLIKDTWNGDNLLGQILMSVRESRNSININNNRAEDMIT